MNTTDKLSFIALDISITTFCFSWYQFSKTDELNKVAFNKNFRPYVSAMNLGVLNKKTDVQETPINYIIIKILNAPALITSKKLNFYIRENNIDSLIFEHPEFKDDLMYPYDNTQYGIGTDSKFITHEYALSIGDKTLIRKIRIEYQWISDSSLKYYFYAVWKYNNKDKTWVNIYQKAN